VHRVESRYECAHCRYQGSLTAGTVHAYTRTDLRKWFLVIWLLASTKKAPSAAELSRQLGVTVKTAWLMGSSRRWKPCSNSAFRGLSGQTAAERQY